MDTNLRITHQQYDVQPEYLLAGDLLMCRDVDKYPGVVVARLIVNVAHSRSFTLVQLDGDVRIRLFPRHEINTQHVFRLVSPPSPEAPSGTVRVPSSQRVSRDDRFGP